MTTPPSRLPVRLDIRPISAARADLVLIRGTEVLAVLGTWTSGAWDLTPAGCAADRIRKVLPQVEARAAKGWQKPWSAEPATVGLHAVHGCKQTARTWTGA